MKYFGGCDVGSTYTKAVILDETGKMVADTTIMSKINSQQSAELAMQEVINQVPELNSSKDLAYLIGTGYGRNKVPFADENISEISCHAMGVHITDPTVKAIIDIGGQDVKGINIDTDGTVKNFAMNDKCSAGTGRFFEAMARSFEMSLEDFSKLSLGAKNVIPITAQCTVFAESEVITLVGQHNAHWGMCEERRTKGSDRACAETQGHQPEDRPAADGSARRGRICKTERPCKEIKFYNVFRDGYPLGNPSHFVLCAIYPILTFKELQNSHNIHNCIKKQTVVKWTKMSAGRVLLLFSDGHDR